MSSNPTPFAFRTEFTPHGDIVGSPNQSFLTRQQAEALAAGARRDGEEAVRQTTEANFTAAFERISLHLARVEPLLALIADQLRREAAELALAAARAIAGKALDQHGANIAAEAIAEVVQSLKAKPEIIVSAPPAAMPAIEARIAGMRPPGAVTFRPEPAARLGDWRVEWGEGAMAFRREDIEAAVNAAIADRLAAPVETQLDLFNAAQETSP
jgi:flagellar assembly protein FliH